MSGLLYKFKWYILVVIAMLIIEPVINAWLNFWLQNLFNAAMPGAERIVILRLLTVGFLMWMTKRVVLFLSNVLKARFVCSAKQELKETMFSRLMKFDTSNISGIAASGEYISVFTNDVMVLEQGFFKQVINLVSGVLSLVILSGSFVALNAKLAVAIIVFGAITAFVPVFFSNYLNNKNLEYSKTMSDFTQILKEYLVAYPTIKNYSVEEKILEHFNVQNREAEGAKFEADYAIILANAVGSLLSWFMQFIAVGLGLMFVIKGEILIGTVVSAQSFASDLAVPLQEIVININSIRSVKQIVKKMEKFPNEQKTVQEMNINKCQSIGGDTEISSGVSVENGGDIVFENLCLEAEGMTIIDHFSFSFEEGKKYLILGLNGSGKSSVFKVLKKWFNDYSGRVLVAGQEIHTLSSEQLSKKISYLSENVSLLSGTVCDNILLYRNYNSEVLQNAIKAAQVRLDLERDIIDEGRNISSGEQRRIEIARSLMDAPDVLIFDEVVSTLDIETAYEIEELALGFSDKTVIFISHNFSGKLIRKYDQILIMENGKLLSHGNYDELIKICPYFQRLCEIKFG